ncbi:MAG: M4 family metallopeptidase [Desulfurellaceae bacterium]|nr:M4 family metallopeptidase [Desulfurellaceae bacterium]
MATRRQYQQGQLGKAFGGAIALLTIFLLSWNLADGSTPALSLHPLAQPGTLVPASESLEVDPDPRATVLAQRLRQHLAGLQTATPYTPPPQLTAEQRQALSELETRCPGEVSVSLRPLAGTPRQIKGAVLQQAQHGISAVGDSQLTTARTFLRMNCDLLRLDDPNAELVLVRRHTDELDRTHLRFRQQYQGVPVWPADIIVHLNPEGHVDVMNGAFVPTPKDLSITPTLDEATAVEYARTGLTDGDRAEVTSSELIIYAPGNTPPRLAWKLELTIGLTAQWVVVIDAENGDELTAYNQVMHQHYGRSVKDEGVDLFSKTRQLNVWEQDGFRWMIDTSKDEEMFRKAHGWHDWIQRGAIWVRDAGNQEILFDAPVVRKPVPGDGEQEEEPPSFLPDAVSAAYNLSETYDYYLERHDRKSFDGEGASIHAIVRHRQNYKNAFWLPGSNLIVFGDGRPFAGALDIVGHELTHGVIEHSANLLYQNQPGALNEAFADIFGEMIEAWSTKDEPDWITGRDLALPASGGGGPDLGRPIRNMKDPGAFLTHFGRPYPKHMDDFFHIQENNGGIHINSTIISHAFYLLVKGLQDFYGSVEGREALRGLPNIGCPAGQGTLRNARQSWRHAMCDAERIFYHALTNYLVQNSQFIDARQACEMAAEYLIENEKEKQYIPARAAEETAKAFAAVGIDGVGTTPNPPIPVVRGPDATLFVYRDVLGQFRLGRREAAQDDGKHGVQLAEDIVVRARPSVSRGGGLAVFVNAENDLCFIAAYGNGEECIDFSSAGTSYDTVASVALSPDGRLLGVVFPDDPDTPAQTISVIHLVTGVARTFLLPAFSYAGPTPDLLPSASTMNFTADGQWLIYDALSAVTVSGDEDQLLRRGQWSLYALNLQTNRSVDLIPPRRGVHYAFPALGQTNDNFLTFDMFDETRNESTVHTAKLWTGEMEEIATVWGGFGVPGFTGDDTALVFSQYDPNVSTGFSLCKQPLGQEEDEDQDDDKVPCADAGKARDGELSEEDWWLENAEMGVIYRRRLSRPGLIGRLEHPSHGSLQSGTGQFSGWVCITGPGGEPPPPAVPEVAERYFYDALEHKESSVDNRGNWWARTGSGNKTHITGQTTVQEVVDHVRRFTISYVDNDGHDRTEFYETLLGASGIFTIDIGNVRLSWPITGLSKSTLPPPPRSPAGTVIPPRITIDVDPGATVRNQDGSPWVPVPLTQTMDELDRDMYVVHVLQPYVPGRSDVSSVEIEINDTTRIPAPYGTERRDTTSVCGDSKNGFVLPFNWNLLGDGRHTVRALADGVEFDSATFTVTTTETGSRRGAER